MKIKACTGVKPVFIQEGEFTSKEGQKIKYYSAVCVIDNECDKISVKPDVAPELSKYIGSDVPVWIECDTNGAKPKIIAISDKAKKA